MSSRAVVANEAASEMDESQVVVALALPADEETAISVVPTIRALDDPPSRFARSAWARKFAASSNVWRDAAPSKASFDLIVVVAFVEAAVERTPAVRRSVRRIVDDTQCHPHIGHVCRADDCAEGDALRVGDDVTLRSALGAIGGVRARLVPPFGALTITPSRAVHFQSMPATPS